MIIDIHTHLPVSEKRQAPNDSLVLTSLPEDMQRCRVDRAVLLPIAPLTPNEDIRDACRAHPELVGFASVDIHRPDACLAELAQAVREGGLKGLKLHPRLQKMNDSHADLVVELTRLAADLNIPVLMDAFFYGAAGYGLDVLRLIARLSQDVPQARIIIAHLGGFKVLEATLMAKENPNLYMDLSFSPLYFEGSSVEQDIAFAMKKLGPDRLLFGSDFPHMDMAKSIAKVRELMERVGFNDAEQARVMGENARELLGI
ncbi:amidohydrolase family protein [Desulforhabdus sp. TSK]|uniref:amidohydrolase family protein n=1 Tax=Desulforhabdus sp. TSK TaxID=2925014 RepID=UPI001FC87A1C|nr:amidohydrolase family protein [Desulforhabdus sp. TSK]GKT08095.1 amidohydrolase [Desulforhabdus sp. TSK]